MNMGLIKGPMKDSNSTLRSLVVQGGNSRDGEGLEDCALELDPRTSSTDEGSLQRAVGKECVRLDQLTNIDIQDEVKFGLVTSHKTFFVGQGTEVKGSSDEQRDPISRN